MRICFFGDSFVNGTGDDDALGWVGRVVAGARRNGLDLTAYNLGIRGNTSADVAARWLAEASLRLPAECDGRLLFSFGANDCAPAGIGASDAGPRVERSLSLSNAARILEAASRWRPTLMVGPGTIPSEPIASERIRVLSADFSALCERLGVPYLDISALTLSSEPWNAEALAGDGAHPNRAGYALVADAVGSWQAWRDWLVPARR